MQSFSRLGLFARLPQAARISSTLINKTTTASRARASFISRMTSSSATSYSTTTPTSDSSPPSQTTSTSTSTSEIKPKQPLALPEIPHNASTPTQLDLSTGSTSVKLDHLGPMVVNVDGTLSRISNWDAMAEVERDNTLRVIGRRNKVRLEALKAKEREGKEGEGEK